MIRALADGRQRHRPSGSLMATALAGVLAGTLALGAGSAAAQDSKPAVSELNGKLNIAGGGVETLSVYFIEGSVTAPLGHSFGLQVDGLGGLHDGDGMGGGAAHLFWRDPALGLVGLYGSGFANTAGVNYTAGNVGIEAALYVGRFTVEGLVGGQFVDELDSDVFGLATVAYYPIDDLRLHGGYRYWFGEHTGTVGFEWQLPGQNDDSINFGLFADAQFRENEAGAWGGLRVFFGSQKPLIRRHREDDPIALMPWDITVFNAPPPPPAGGNNNAPPPEECPVNVRATALVDECYPVRDE